MAKKILIICYSDNNNEPRLLMQCSALKANYNITTAGFSSVNDPAIHFIQLNGDVKKALVTFHLKLPKLLRLPFSAVNKLHVKLSGNSMNFFADDYHVLSKQKFDLIICHHPASLELANKLKRDYKCKLIFNAHEIYPYEFEENEEWMAKNFKTIDTLLKKCLPFCDAIFTVNKEICDFYKEKYNAQCLPVHNSKPYYELPVQPVATPIRVIHHGGAMQRRKLEQMADAVLAQNGKYELTFMLVKNTTGDYLKTLIEKYQSKGIKFIDAVPYDKIVTAINNYDVGLYILPNENINQQLALPNKLFEFIQAKLAVIASPNPAMKNIILDNKVGKVAGGFDVESMSNTLASLTADEIFDFKKQSQKISMQLSSSADEAIILKTVNHLLN